MDGASFEERIIGAVRTDNEQTLGELLATVEPARRGAVINGTEDSVGRKLIHIAPLYGSYECLFQLLDNEGIEIDPRERLQGDTPLHCALRYAERDPKVGGAIVNLLIECGASIALKNKQGKTPIDLAKAANLTDIANSLRGAQYAAELGAAEAGADVDVDLGADGPAGEDDDDAGSGLSGEEDEDEAADVADAAPAKEPEQK